MKIAVIPDSQVKPDVDLAYLEAVGNYIVAKQPEIVVHLGDFADMPSLSSYDKGTKSFEGRRYKKDIEAAHEGMRTLLKPLNDYNDRQATQKKKQYNPRRVMLYGNHENRILRAINKDSMLDGTIGLEDLKYKEFGWETHDFLEVVNIEGICFSHFFVSGVMGRPVTTAQALLTKKHVSCIAGHQQGKQIATAVRGDGKRITGIITGSCLTPDHKVLTADLRYVPLGDVKEGDKLVSFEEYAESSSKHRNYKTGTVLRKKIAQDTVYAVTLDSGKTFKVTSDHKWLTRMRRRGGKYEWLRTDELKIGTAVPRLLPEWEEATTYDSGWACGLVEGRGHWRQNHNIRPTSYPYISLHGYAGEVAHLERGMGRLGFELKLDGADSSTSRLRIAGGTKEEVRLLGTIRPVELLREFRPEMLGAVHASREKDNDVVVSIVELGVQDIVRIEIDAGTMIVEGYGHHNCYDHQEDYLGPQGNEHWRGMLMCYEVNDGQFDEGFISLDYLKGKYS